MRFVYLFDSSSSEPETPLMDFRYRPRFRMRVIGRCVRISVIYNDAHLNGKFIENKHFISPYINHSAVYILFWSFEISENILRNQK